MMESERTPTMEESNGIRPDNHIIAEPQTTRIDLSLDVKGRLEQLHTWDCEVKASDEELAHRVMQLNEERRKLSDKRGIRMIDQKAAEIGVIRRRNAILGTRSPLEISPEAMTPEGYGAVAGRLAAQYATLTEEERLFWLATNTYFLFTPDIRPLHEKMVHILKRTERAEQRNLLIGGNSGLGKTRFLEWYAALYAPKVKPEYNFVPVILVEAQKDDKTTKSLLQKMIVACGELYVDGDPVTHLFDKIGRLFQVCRVRMVMVDEVNHLSDDVQRRRLLEIANRTIPVSLICAAVDPLKFRENSPEIAGRFIDYHRLQPYTGKRLQGLLTLLELVIPFSEPSYLAHFELEVREGKRRTTVSGPAAFIEKKAKGSLRYIMRLITDAAERAIKERLPSISMRLLQDTWVGIQSSDPDEPYEPD